MQVKIGDLVAGENALAELAQAQVSARLSFTLALVLREVGKHLDAKRAAHQKLLEKVGTPRQGSPGHFEIAPDRRAEFDREFRELLDTEIVLSGIGKIKTSALDADGIKLSAENMLALAWLLKDDLQPLFD